MGGETEIVVLNRGEIPSSSNTGICRDSFFYLLFIQVTLILIDSLISHLRTSILRLKAEFISEDGSSVDYHGMSQSETFKSYKELTVRLQKVDLDELQKDEQERKAFFINLYNVQMIHALVAQEDLPENPIKVQVRNSDIL